MEKEEIVMTSSIEVPRGKGIGRPISVDLKAIVEAEHRIAEIAFMTTQKAPELLYTFNKAWKDLHELVIKVKTEKTYAEIEMARVKGELILDVIPGILKQKGLARDSSPAGSADLRQAVLDTNPVYLAAQERANEITAAYEFLKGKLDSFRMAYESTKKILGETGYMANNRDPDFSYGAEPDESQTKPTGMGRARFGR